MNTTNTTTSGSAVQLLPAGPGIYKIFCKQTKLTYYGESNNVLWRVGLHIKYLEKNKHKLKKLQDDWNTFGGLAAFEFYVVDSGPHLALQHIRRKQERELINDRPDLCYNIADSGLNVYIGGSTLPRLSHLGVNFPVIINNQSFPSLRSINRAFPMSRNEIKKRLLQAHNVGPGVPLTWTEPFRSSYDPEVENQRFQKKRGQKSKPFNNKIQINGVVYNNVVEAAEKLNKSRSTIYRDLNDINKPKVVYLNTRGDVIPKEFYGTKVNQKSTFVIKGEYFDSISDIVSKYKLCKSTIYRRCNSTHPRWKDWIRNLTDS